MKDIKDSIENFAYTTETRKKFDEAVVSVLKAIDQKGLTVFQIYDLKERLAAKGFQHSSLKIIEFCAAKHANNLLNKNKYISLCMPCRIAIIEEDNKIKIGSMNPTVMGRFFPNVKKEDTEAIENDIKGIIDNAK